MFKRSQICQNGKNGEPKNYGKPVPFLQIYITLQQGLHEQKKSLDKYYTIIVLQGYRQNIWWQLRFEL